MTDCIWDANSLWARAWYAVMRTQPDPAMAVEAALVSATSLLSPASDRIEKIDRMLFCWDGRQAPDKGRKEKPEHYVASRKVFQEFLTDLFGAVHAEIPDHEADDLVATAATNSDADQVYVISGDKDLTQLQNPRIHYYCLHTKAVLSASFICNRWGVRHPDQVAIALAIIGDRVDGIPGVPRWGPAKSKHLFGAVTSQMKFDQAFAAIERQIPFELRAHFYESLERTLLNRQVPGLPPPAPLRLQPLDYVKGFGMPDLYRHYVALHTHYFGRKMTKDNDGDEADV